MALNPAFDPNVTEYVAEYPAEATKMIYTVSKPDMTCWLGTGDDDPNFGSVQYDTGTTYLVKTAEDAPYVVPDYPLTEKATKLIQAGTTFLTATFNISKDGIVVPYVVRMTPAAATP